MSATEGTSGFGTLLQYGDGGVGNGTQASRTIGTSNQQIIIKAKEAGTAGNSKTCSIVVSGASTAFALSVTEDNITITSATDGSSLATTTVNEALYQLMQNDDFALYWEATRGAGNGTGVLVAGASAALSGGTEGAEIFATIAEIRDITLDGRTLELIDATHMESPDASREYIPSLKDSGTIGFTGNYLPGSASQQILETRRAARTRNNYRVIWTNTDGDNTDTFAGYVVAYNPSANIEDKLSFSGSIKITSSIVSSET